MSDYRIYLDEELICKTDWAPMAQAAWHRVSRERNAAQHGGRAVIVKDDVVLADVQPETLRGHRWPDQSGQESDLRDVIKAALSMLRHAGVNTIDVADAMTTAGLPTTRARIDALKGSTQGKRTEVCAAEVVAMLYAVIPLIKE